MPIWNQSSCDSMGLGELRCTKLRSPSFPSVTMRMTVFRLMPCCRREPSKKWSLHCGLDDTNTKRAPSFPSRSTRPAVTWNWRASKLSTSLTTDQSVRFGTDRCNFLECA